MKTVYLPLESMPICGHSYPGLIDGDLMMGREEGCRSVISGMLSTVHVQSVTLCRISRIEKHIAALKKAERAKTAGNSGSIK